MITVFSNGAMVSRTDADTLKPIVLTENAQPGDTFLVAIRIQAAENSTKISASRLLITPPATRPDPGIFRQEIVAVQPIVAAFPEGRAEHEAILEAAAKSVDLSALDRGDQVAFDESLRKAQSKLQTLTPWLKQFTIRADGNSHIDMAWLWPWTETVEVVRSTFRSALDLMREYPDFKFTMSSARAYSWMEEKYPDLFKEIQERGKPGRWEIVGGRRDQFVAEKLMWAHEFTVFTHKLFWWEAPDGSRLLTYFPHDYAMGIDPVQLGKDVSVWVPAIYGTKPPASAEMMHLYGVGDHGGGAPPAMFDTATGRAQTEVVVPQFELSTATAIFSGLEPEHSAMNEALWSD